MKQPPAPDWDGLEPLTDDEVEVLFPGVIKALYAFNRSLQNRDIHPRYGPPGTWGIQDDQLWKVYRDKSGDVDCAVWWDGKQWRFWSELLVGREVDFDE